MGKPIYELVQGKPKEAWYALSTDEREEIFAKVLEINKKAGSKIVIQCDSMWSSGRWQGFTVKEYPSVEAYQQHYMDLHEIDWWRYVEFETTLGIRDAEESAET